MEQRRTGRTTRLVDSTIQELFTDGYLILLANTQPISESEIRTIKMLHKGQLIIEPDYIRGNLAQQMFAMTVLDRIRMEHPDACTITDHKSWYEIRVKQK